MKTALITGITGQDGSYLAELLLHEGYRVVGMVRHTSQGSLGRIKHILDDVELVNGDLLDQPALITILQTYKPDEVYNLAAQSFVPTSFNQPVLTGEVTGLGVTRVLDAIRLVDPGIRFYQASSSEMFGKVEEVPQNERTPFHPRSPYGAAKVYGHHMTVNYRESYGLFACSGILFNHECISERTPLIVRSHHIANIVTPSELVPLRRKGPSQQMFDVSGLQVWDGENWTDVKAITATRRRRSDADHRMLLLQTRGGAVEVTAHHHMLDAEGLTLPAREVHPGMHLAMATGFPAPSNWTALTEELAEFLGLMTAEGHVSQEGRIQFTNNDPALRERAAELWSKLFLGASATRFGTSGWNGHNRVGQLYLNGARPAWRWLHQQLYNVHHDKRVPPLVLNGTKDIQAAFLAGYYAGDGLKAGNGDSIKTKSPVLAQGLCWLYANLGRWCSVYAEQRSERTYYQLNIGSSKALGGRGLHLHKPASEVRSITRMPDSCEWVFDLETGSGRLCAGVGRLVAHNSPRRGLEFVTRKVSHGVARIARGLQSELHLGNLEAKRDWGFAGDYVRAMWQMLQAAEPGDYVVATGQTHSVRELVEAAFGHVGLDYRDHVVVDEELLRVAEVDLLVGDASKARAELGWEPVVGFEDLVRMMVDSDLELVQNEGMMDVAATHYEG